MIKFKEMYDLLIKRGPGKAVSRRGTIYKIIANDGIIIAFPRKSKITIHKDCWGKSLTCQGTRAGGIYNGPYSIYDWYNDMEK